MRLDVDRHGAVTSRLVVERAETLDLLRRDAAQIERALQDAGVKTANNSLQFMLRDQTFGDEQHAQAETGAARHILPDPDLAAVETTPQHHSRWPGLGSAISAAVSNSTAANSASSNQTLASNFQAFLQLLTTQLKNQSPLDPLDTNQFTQQLVQFAQVEQQLRSNDKLATLVALQKTTQATAVLGFVGATVVIDGSTSRLNNNQAVWNFAVERPASGTISITSANGQLAYSRHLHHQSWQPVVRLGRSRQRRHPLAEWRLHDLRHLQGRQRPDGRGLDRG